MNRKKPNLGGLESLIATGNNMFNGRLSAISSSAIRSTARFRGKLGAAISVITSLIVGFLTIPNNILYFIGNEHKTRTKDPGEHDYAYIHAGIALIVIGCLAMVVSIVLSYFAAKSKRKMDFEDARGPESTKSTKTVLACLIMMNIELFMAVIAGCMELLYQPLINDAQRLHNMECAIAVFNIIIYIMYVVTMVLTSCILKEKHPRVAVDTQRDFADGVAGREHMSRSNTYLQSSFM